MTHSTFVQPLPVGMVASNGYLTTDKPDTGFEGVTESPAGGLSSTAADMAIFGQMLLGQGTYKGVKILEPASVATLFTPQFTPAPGVSPWDLGFYTERRNGLDFIGHGGDLIACHSQFWVEPKHGLSFFISYNSAGSAKTAREELFRAFVDRYLPGAPAPHPAYLKLTAKELAPYTGYYLSSRREASTKLGITSELSPRQIVATVDEKTKESYLTSPTLKDFRDQPLRLHPIGNDEFYEEQSQGIMHFERDDKGKISGIATPSHADRASFLVRPTRPLQLACWSVVAVVVFLVVLGTHIGDVTSFYQIGHLDRWFMVQNVISGIALLAIFVGVLSGLASLTRPVRLITKTKMLLVTLACAYMGWFLIYFHFVGSATKY
jgi:hypothetical protein